MIAAHRTRSRVLVRTWRAAAPRSPRRGRAREASPNARPATSGPSSPGARPDVSPAIAASLERLREWAVNTARRFGAPSAEDAAQEAFLRAMRSAETFAPAPDVPHEVALRRWLAGILAHVVADAWTAERRQVRARESAPANPSIDPFGAVAARQVLRRILQAFPAATSPARFRAFLGHDIDGTPAHEIARQEGAPEGTIWTRIHAARRDLEAMLAREKAAERFERTRRMRRGRR